MFSLADRVPTLLQSKIQEMNGSETMITAMMIENTDDNLSV
jgi:hypothetical protein